MSLFDFQRAVRASSLTSTERLVLLTLTTWASGAGPRWEVWPSNEELADACAVSLRTLKGALQGLERAGWIARANPHARRTLTLQSPPAATPRQGKICTTSGAKTALPVVQDLHYQWCNFCPTTSKDEETTEETTEETRQREEKKSPCPASASAAPVTPDLPLRVPPREDAHAAHAHERTHEAATAARGALSPQAQGQGRALSALSEPEAEADPDLAQAWARLWGGAAPAPPALLWLRRERGREAALTALSWLLYKRASEGVRSPGRVAQYLADDLREGRRQARGWRWEELEEVAGGASPLSFWAPEGEVEEVAQGFEAEEVQPEPAEPIAPPEVARVYLRQMRLARLICEGRSDDMRGRAEGRYRDGAPYRPDRYPPAGATEADWDAWGERELEAQEARAALRLVAGGAR